MTTEKRYLTKSRFQTALECPTKLYYVKKDEYPNTKQGNDFLAALAEGGFQVGALAKCYHPGGHDIKTLDYDESLEQTKARLLQETVTIFEAAIQYENLFIRVDILEKTGNHINLIEVKAKSIHPDEDDFTEKKTDFIQSGWLPYLNDVAFQTWVVEKAFPRFTVEPFLMLADKSKTASVEGLNQHFFLNKADKRPFVEIKGDVTPENLGEPVLVKIPVRHLVQKIFDGTDRARKKKSTEELKPFEKRIAEYSRYYETDQKFPVTLGGKCKGCEYRITPDKLKPGQKSGYEECWREKLGWGAEEFSKPHVFDIWYGDSKKFISDGLYLLEQLNAEDLYMERTKDGTLDYKKGRAERQYLQITQTLDPDAGETIKPELFTEMMTWQYPLHFIDFETSMVAIPFNKGRRPYEQIAFQFSAHTVYEDGTFRHDEWIAREPGQFPNFDFVRALKAVLDKDNGTIFRYAPHENTVLRQIQEQLAGSDGPDDADELIGWIDTITQWTEEAVINGKKKTIKHPGDRNMVDLCKMVVNYYYHPAMQGSNSIKVVLPAVMQSSAFLKEKYSKPYNSQNYQDIIWWQEDQDKRLKIKDKKSPKDPYKLLPPIFEDIDLGVDELVLESENIAEGGAAMTAYARMQFTEMSAAKRDAVIKGLLKYCELDTLAMVMIWEHWKSIV